ncbi:unnamed protein product [Tilletia controversa]|uniref:FHA domain-containing protein n=3 Tax=Tilletia TaxID=13289 RepID=A0A8X7SRW8_9BASI|nr:hypothetical protein CF335_g8980 [Tilletia laevis]KAE8190624.1 hypothetical protein CF328_g5917 [Tilletia controversa]KAE8237911.1 hypothetical protein A4X03_0g9007 [Tilletia caries]KAE8183150.1 hypothetical protein CF336_g8283 [Tilletia laevis]KAE8236872.1 hypothetical protein A4X06_0g9410 [Tilletia controversa]
MTSPAFFLAFTPVNDHCHLPAQSICISHFDNIHLLLGGKHSSYYRRQDVPHHTADFIFDHSNLEPDHAVVAYTDGAILIAHTGDASAIHINGKMLATDVKQELFDGDDVELGHLDAYTSNFRCVLRLRVTISDTPPRAFIFHSTSSIPTSYFIFTTSTALLAWNQLLASNERLSEQLDETQIRLQHTLDALHTASSTPPRTYQQLLQDLRSASERHASASPTSVPTSGLTSAQEYANAADLTSGETSRPATSVPTSVLASDPQSLPTSSSTSSDLEDTSSSCSGESISPTASSTSPACSPAVIACCDTDVIPVSTPTLSSTLVFPPRISVLSTMSGSTSVSTSVPKDHAVSTSPVQMRHSHPTQSRLASIATAEIALRRIRVAWLDARSRLHFTPPTSSSLTATLRRIRAAWVNARIELALATSGLLSLPAVLPSSSSLPPPPVPVLRSCQASSIDPRPSSPLHALPSSLSLSASQPNLQLQHVGSCHQHHSVVEPILAFAHHFLEAGARHFVAGF